MKGSDKDGGSFLFLFIVSEKIGQCRASRRGFENVQSSAFMCSILTEFSWKSTKSVTLSLGLLNLEDSPRMKGFSVSYVAATSKKGIGKCKGDK